VAASLQISLFFASKVRHNVRLSTLTRGSKMRSTWVALGAIFCLVAAVAATSAAASAPRSKLAADAASGFVPSRHANHAKTRLVQLQSHNGPVMHATTVIPLFWGSNWSTTGFVGDKITGLDYFYSHVGGSGYAHTNFEYTDGSGHVNTSSISKAPTFAMRRRRLPLRPRRTRCLPRSRR
jgi:hypothetical protein